jgi:hypothetical protein
MLLSQDTESTYKIGLLVGQNPAGRYNLTLLSLLTLCDSKLWLIKTKMCDGGGRAVTYSIISLLKIVTFFVCLIVIVATYKPVSDIRHLSKTASHLWTN